MKIQTFTVVAGSTACNARCPFCISKQTPVAGVPLKAPDVNWRNLDIGIQIAQTHSVTTALITGKGEPTLFPEQLGMYVRKLGAAFPLVELQTNGLVLQQAQWRETLDAYYQDGLTTIALSTVGWDNGNNREIYTPGRAEYPDLATTIDVIHQAGLSVRLGVMMAAPYFDSPEHVERLMAFVATNRVEQTTLRPVVIAGINANADIARWGDRHLLSKHQLDAIVKHVQAKATKVMTLAHGAEIYDYKGHNLALTDCLTLREDTDDLRQLIFFPDGALRYDWQYEGARLL